MPTVRFECLATVISRAEASEGLALLEQRRFDVLVLEFLLADIDGVKLLRQPHRHIAPAVSRS